MSIWMLEAVICQGQLYCSVLQSMKTLQQLQSGQVYLAPVACCSPLHGVLERTSQLLLLPSLSAFPKYLVQVHLFSWQIISIRSRTWVISSLPVAVAAWLWVHPPTLGLWWIERYGLKFQVLPVHVDKIQQWKSFMLCSIVFVHQNMQFFKQPIWLKTNQNRCRFV